MALQLYDHAFLDNKLCGSTALRLYYRVFLGNKLYGSTIAHFQTFAWFFEIQELKRNVSLDVPYFYVLSCQVPLRFVYEELETRSAVLDGRFRW